MDYFYVLAILSLLIEIELYTFYSTYLLQPIILVKN